MPEIEYDTKGTPYSTDNRPSIEQRIQKLNQMADDDFPGGQEERLREIAELQADLAREEDYQQRQK
jgi:hypothetical protein